MRVKIIPFTMESYDKVFALWQRCDGIGLGESDSRENIQFFLNRNPDMSFIATINDDIVGAVLAGHDGRRGYIYHLAISTKHRRQGLGRLLVDRCLKTMDRIGIVKCHIFIFNNNIDGQKFWESLGWSYRKDIGVVSKFIVPGK